MNNKAINVGIRLVEKNDAEAIELLDSVDNKSTFIRNLLNGINKDDVKAWVQNQEDLSASLRQAIKFFMYQFGTENANDAIMKKSLGQSPTITVQEKIEETPEIEEPATSEENDESLDEDVISGVDELDITEKDEEPTQEEADDDSVPNLDLSMLNRKI